MFVQTTYRQFRLKVPTRTCWIQPPLPWVIIRTGVENSLRWFLLLPLVFSFSHPWLLFSPGFSLLPTLGYYSALGFLFFPPWAIIQPLVFHFYPPLAKILSFSSLVYNISHSWFFTFFNPWLLFSPSFFLLPTLFIILPLVFSSPTIGCYSALGFSLFPSLATVFNPWFSTSIHPWLLSCPWLVFSFSR